MFPGVVVTLIFGGSLYFIFSDKLHRTIAAVAGAALMVAAGLALGIYTEDQAIASIDFNTLGLLLGMMILVARAAGPAAGAAGHRHHPALDGAR